MHMLSILLALLATGVFLTLAFHAMEKENDLAHALKRLNEVQMDKVCFSYFPKNSALNILQY